MTRKIIQIVATPDSTDYYAQLYALCDDGTVWNTSIKELPDEEINWKQIKNVPQD